MKETLLERFSALRNRWEPTSYAMKKAFLEQFSARNLLKVVARNSILRGMALKLLDRSLRRMFLRETPELLPKRVREDRYLGARNLLGLFHRMLRRNNMAPAYLENIVKAFADKSGMQKEAAVRRFEEKHGCTPPFFLTVSPGQGCNLRCTGCYAGTVEKAANLDFDVLCRIVREKEELWGSYFTVISGGEPLLYRSKGRDIFDLFTRYDEEMYLMYTNGTLITPERARRLAACGNVFPAVSVEGFRKETDARRGKGTFDRVLEAFRAMREAGVPFGISVTATRENVELVSSDEFLDFYFEEQGALFCWMFQYMPIGCSYTLDMMITPEQRVRLLEREAEILREKGLFYVDFWNGGPLSKGCIAAGRPSGGYMYITWDGDVTPCVFFPYSTCNILAVYEEGGTLDTAWRESFHADIRRWQQEYGYGQPARRVGNWFAPCPMRDHHAFALETIRKRNARPIDPEAEKALGDEAYHEGLIEYGRRFREASDVLWQRYAEQRE